MARSWIVAIDSPHAPAAPRIGIGGRFLDEITLASSRDPQGRPISRTAFPASRHKHQWAGDVLMVRSPAATVAALLAGGALPVIGGGATTVELDGQVLGRFELDGIDLCGQEGGDTIVRLRLRRSESAGDALT